jgi:hypothetical protein
MNEADLPLGQVGFVFSRHQLCQREESCGECGVDGSVLSLSVVRCGGSVIFASEWKNITFM